MALKPINDYNEPKYPKIGIVFQEPDLLLKSVPSAWRANKLIAGALISLSLVSCSTKLVPYNKSKTAQLIQNKDSLKVVETKKEAKKIAPLFVHGDGVGGYACISFSSPVFISEADAMKIILSELEKYGLIFKDTFIQDSTDQWQSSRFKKGGDLYPYYYNKDLNLGISYISSEANSSYPGAELVNSNSFSGYSYNTKKPAQSLRDSYENEDLINFAVFYDPIKYNKVNVHRISNLKESKYYQESVELLLEQVEDFVEWMVEVGLLVEDK